MKKDAYYFSHDSNAFSDPKIQKLMMKHGLEGYAFYFICIEMMRNQKDYKIDNDSAMIAYSLRIEEPLVKLMITECLTLGLFISDSGKLFSDSFLRRMKMSDTIRNKRIENGKKGGRPKKQEPLVKLSLSKTKASKGKEKKEKEKKYNPKEAAKDIKEIDQELWGEWVNHKRKVKAQVTKIAIDANIRKLKDFGLNKANKIIQLALEKGWKDFYEEKQNQGFKDNSKPSNHIMNNNPTWSL